MSVRRYAAKRDANERALVRELEQLGFYVIRNSARDLPDLTVVRGDLTAYVEVKTSTGKPTAGQVEMIERIRQAGGHAFVARTAEDVLEYWGMI